jgi:hypothetical protein
VIASAELVGAPGHAQEPAAQVRLTLGAAKTILQLAFCGQDF